MILEVFLSAALMGAPPERSELPANVIPRCIVSVIHDIKVPAQEAGVLTGIEVKEGMLIEKDKQLGLINDVQSQMQLRASQAELSVARLKADDDVNVRYSKAAFAVSEKELQLHQQANVNQRVTSAVEMNKLRLQVEQAGLQIEKSEHERKIAGSEADVSQAKVELAQEQIRRRKILSPIDGEVVEILARAGEWVEPGNPVFRVVGLQKLRVEGFANFTKLSPSDASNRPVTVTVQLSRGRQERFNGKIVFVHPIVLAGGMYRVWAEVENRVENGQFLLRPGVEATMTIDNSLQAAALNQ